MDPIRLTPPPGESALLEYYRDGVKGPRAVYGGPVVCLPLDPEEQADAIKLHYPQSESHGGRKMLFAMLVEHPCTIPGYEGWDLAAAYLPESCMADPGAVEALDVRRN